MNRRNFLKGLGAAGLGMAIGTASAVLPDNRIGYLTVESHHLRVRKEVKVHLNGVDISQQCYAADDRAGMAWCYKLNQGRRYWDYMKDDVAREILRGKVEFVMPEDLRAELLGKG